MSKLMEMKVLHTFDTLLCLSAHKGNRRGSLKSTILPQTDKGYFLITFRSLFGNGQAVNLVVGAVFLFDRQIKVFVV